MWNLPRSLLMTGAFLASGAVAGPGGPLLLVDFPQSVESLPWFVVNDDVMGGRSEGGLRLEGDVAIFSGSTNTRGGGFSSIRSGPHSFDLSAYDGVRLRARGDGRTYTFRLNTSDTRDRRRRPAYWAEFETSDGTWEEIDVPFTRFGPRWRGATLPGPALEPAAIDSLGLMINDGQDGPFRLEVDWIVAYREVEPFSLGALRWEKRPLLLFGAGEGDPILRKQLDAVEAAREGFDERDMVLIVVLGEGTSRIEGRPLSLEDARLLRASFEIGKDEFALRLVGKDGDVKRASSTVVAMKDIYDQIDAMPMRQQELR
jgi:NADH dehydrogenase [ubiquinone] 1 alpha subcomplex assembly factor 1